MIDKYNLANRGPGRRPRLEVFPGGRQTRGVAVENKTDFLRIISLFVGIRLRAETTLETQLPCSIAAGKDWIRYMDGSQTSGCGRGTIASRIHFEGHQGADETIFRLECAWILELLRDR